MYSSGAGALASSLGVKTVREHGHRDELLNISNTQSSNRQGITMWSLFMGQWRDGRIEGWRDGGMEGWRKCRDKMRRQWYGLPLAG